MNEDPICMKKLKSNVITLYCGIKSSYYTLLWERLKHVLLKKSSYLAKKQMLYLDDNFASVTLSLSK